MGAPKMNRLYCNMCDDNFATKKELLKHQMNHSEPTPAKHVCKTCNWPFDDSLALESHYMVSGHGVLPFQCDNCEKRFLSDAALSGHRKSCAKPVQCDHCHVQFPSELAYNKHRKFPSPCSDHHTKLFKAKSGLTKPNYVDLDAPSEPQTMLRYEDEQSFERSRTPSDVEGLYCRGCKDSFESQANFDRHLLWCLTRNTTINGDTSKETHSRAAATSTENVPPVNKSAASARYQHPAQSLAEASRPLKQAPTMYASLHNAPLPSKQAAPPVQTRPSSNVKSRPQSSVSGAPRDKPPSVRQPAPSATKRPPKPPLSKVSTQASASTPGEFPCDIQYQGECKRVCKSKGALEAHKQDVHGVGGRHPPLHSKRAGVLTPRAQEQLKNQGLLRPSSAAGQAANRAPLPATRAGPPKTAPPAACRVAPTLVPRVTPAPPRAAPMSRPPPPTGPRASMAAAAPPSPATGNAIGGQAEYDQAIVIHGKIARLRIQSDITIQHDGKMLCGGVAWTRIGVAKQADVVGMFDKFTHLPAKLQAKEYLPAPKTFKDDYQAHYPAEDFQHSPDRRSGAPGLAIVALACSKILLQNECQEVVKIAAVDVLTCRVLMSYLVWTDTKASVKDWRPRVTGLSNVGDIEAARQAGYKVLKGWEAARAALWTFIDKETVIVGYNLRGDLDALRMIHGRAVDIAKSVEKAAAGPLSRGQLSLDSLCREYPGVMLKANATFGRDCLLDAFAIREFGLWMLKQGDELVKKAKAKSREYQILPV